jgi:hypothetical protein
MHTCVLPFIDGKFYFTAIEKHTKIIVVGLYNTLNLMGLYIIGRNSILGAKAEGL